MDTVQSPIIEDVVTEAFREFARNPVVCVCNGIVFMLASFLATISLVGILFIPAFYGGFLGSMLVICRNEPPIFGKFFSLGMKQFASFFAANLMLIIGIFFGYVLFILPGIYLSVRWSFVNILIADKKLKAIEAFRQSGQLVKDRWWHVFCLWLIAYIISSLLGLTGIGLIAWPAIDALLFIKYYQLLIAQGY